MKLSKQDAALLVTLYETNEYEALVRMLEARKVDLAIAALGATDMNILSRQQGRAAEIDWILGQVHDLYKKGNK